MRLFAFASMMVVASATTIALAQPAEPAPPPAEPPAAEPPPAEPAPPTTAAPPAAAPVAPQPAPPPPAYYPPPAYAPPPPLPPPPEEPERRVSLTFSPIHLLLPVFELNIEVRLVDHFALAAIGGYGQITVKNFLDESTTVSIYEVGGQIIGYPLKAFESLQVGAELLYLHASADDINGSSATGVAIGYAMGPFIGYKLMTDGGFTFVVQGGAQYASVRGENTADDEEEQRVIPLVNLNIGWSF